MSEPLSSWSALNSHLKAADEAECRRLMKRELKGERRRQFVMRIHSRLNKVRADRERVELEEQLNNEGA